MTAKDYIEVPIEEKIAECQEQLHHHYGYGIRHIQVFFYLICLSISFLTGGHLGVTIVAMTMVDREAYVPAITLAEDAMVNHTNNQFITNAPNYVKVIDEVNANITSVDNKTSLGTWNPYKTYEWPKSIQERVLGSFYLGVSIMMFPMGLVCQRWGGKIVLQIPLLLSGLASILTPWFTSWGGWQTICILRILQGGAQAGLYPAVNTLLSNWVPASERGSLSSYVFAGSSVGSVITFQLAGILGFSRFGWPSTFWVVGIINLIGFALITAFTSPTPDDNKFISEAEKIYIAGSLEDKVETKAKVPWKAVLTSVPVWATIATHIGNSVCFMFFFIELPTYMFGILKVDVMSNGILTSLPHLAPCFSSICVGYLSDFLTNRGIFGVRNARRIFNSIACVTPAICLTVVAYTTNTAVVVTCFIIFLTANTAVNTGWMINYMDLSPNYCGALTATGNTLTNIFTVSLPLIASNIVIDVTDQDQWRIMIFLMAGITFGCNIIFCIFMSADVQPWNSGEENGTKKA